MEFKPYHFEKLPKKTKENLAKGSDTLFFASCRDTDETWLPLLEKAYAKAHGDYQCIESGLAGFVCHILSRCGLDVVSQFSR